MFLTDKIVRKAFCVGGLFYPIRNMFFLVDSLLANKGAWECDTTKIAKSVISPILQEVFNYFFTE